MFRFAVLAAAMALASPAVAFPRVYFFCMTDDQAPPYIRVGPMSPNQSEARFLYPPDHEGARREHDMLWIGETAAGEIRYHAGDLSLILAGEDTALQDGEATLPCVRLELPQDHPRGDYPALARAIGGACMRVPARISRSWVTLHRGPGSTSSPAQRRRRRTDIPGLSSTTRPGWRGMCGAVSCAPVSNRWMACGPPAINELKGHFECA